MNYPTISIVSGLYNTDLTIWEKTLKAIASQDYPKSHVEHIVMDGGSTNGAIELGRKYGCMVLTLPHLLHRACARVGLGIKKAKGDILLLLEPDNIIVGKKWLKEMVQPFFDNPDIIGTFSMFNSYEKNMPVLTRYFNLIGINDPLVYYLGKSEKLSQYESVYRKGELLAETDHYSVIRFTKDTLPTLGDNGHMVKRKEFIKVLPDPDAYLHTDAMAKLLDHGYGVYGAVKNSIIHYSGSNLLKYITRRTTYKGQYYHSQEKQREYMVFDPKSGRDIVNLIRFIVFSLCVLPMIIESIWGYIHKKDSAWFLHPIICLLMVGGYGWSEISHYANLVKNKYILNL
jgi:GT2 family glycosyltransferase